MPVFCCCCRYGLLQQPGYNLPLYESRANENLRVSAIQTQVCAYLWSKTRVGNLLIGFLSNSFVFCEWKSERAIRLWKRVNRSRRSFVMSDLSKSLMVTLLSWATWANHSQLLFCKESFFKKEQISEEQQKQFALGHKKEKNCQKHMKNSNFFEQISDFLLAIRSNQWNHEWITYIALF